jgi:hypothetical protein
VRTVNNASCGDPDDAIPDALEQRRFELLEDPEWPLQAWNGVELSEQLAPPRVVSAKREYDHT